MIDNVDWGMVKDALERYRKVTGDTRHIIPSDNIVTFLENEIRTTRRANCAVDRLTKTIERLEKEIKSHDIDMEFAESVAEAVQEMANKWTETSKRIEQIGQMIENGVNVGQIEDSGKITLCYSGCYQDLEGILLANGYFVCSHVNECESKEDRTITIEYWRA